MIARLSEGWELLPKSGVTTDSNNELPLNELQSGNFEIICENIIRKQEKLPLSIYLLPSSSTDPTSLALTSFHLESNSKICEIYLKSSGGDEKYFGTIKGEKSSPDSGYICAGNGQGALFTSLHIKCLSLQGQKNIFQLNSLKIQCQSLKPSSGHNSSFLKPPPELNSSNPSLAPGLSLPSTTGGEIGINYDMANAFAVYRSILLSDMSRLFDEKLSPLTQKLNRLENRVDQLTHITNSIGSALAHHQYKLASEEIRPSQPIMSETKGEPIVSERVNHEEKDEEITIEILDKEKSHDHEEVLKTDMKHLLHLLRSNPPPLTEGEEHVSIEQQVRVANEEN